MEGRYRTIQIYLPNGDPTGIRINFVWGLSGDTLKNEMELLEYKALMIHTVYASLTLSRERMQ